MVADAKDSDNVTQSEFGWREGLRSSTIKAKVDPGGRPTIQILVTRPYVEAVAAEVNLLYNHR